MSFPPSIRLLSISSLLCGPTWSVAGLILVYSKSDTFLKHFRLLRMGDENLSLLF